MLQVYLQLSFQMLVKKKEKHEFANEKEQTESMHCVDS